MPVSGPNPAESYGGIDFVSYDIPSYGTLYTAAGDAWHRVMETIRAQDRPILIDPDTAIVITVGILDNGPVGLETILPAGSTFEWFLFYTHPNNMSWQGTLADSPWIGVSGFAQAAGTQPGLVMQPPWMSTLPWGTMFYSGPTTMQFTVAATPGPYAGVMGTMPVNVLWFAKWTLPPVYEPPPPIILPPPVIVPVISPTDPPTGIINPTVLPPTVQTHLILEHANPGFTCDIHRAERYDDLVQVFLGQKVALTAETLRARLGFRNRGHIITQTRFRGRATGGNSIMVSLDADYRLEKIPGTLLPGAGSSSENQDAYGTGEDVSGTLRVGTAGTGIGLGGLG